MKRFGEATLPNILNMKWVDDRASRYFYILLNKGVIFLHFEGVRER